MASMNAHTIKEIAGIGAKDARKVLVCKACDSSSRLSLSLFTRTQQTAAHVMHPTMYEVH